MALLTTTAPEVGSGKKRFAEDGMPLAQSTANLGTRPDVSVYWRPGCSSCLKVKEFVEDTGIEFESVNVAATDERNVELLVAEVTEAGLRSIPVVRKGKRFVYAQSLDDVAELLGVTRNHTRLPDAALFERWRRVLVVGRGIVAKFPEDELKRRVIPDRDRSVKDIAVHVSQIVHAYLRQIDEGVTDIKPIQAYVDPAIVTGRDVLAFMEHREGELAAWVNAGKPSAIAARIPTFYGEQEAGQVLERAVWHCSQHVRQLDIVAAGRLGAELDVLAGLFDNLPLPRRLWV